MYNLKKGMFSYNTILATDVDYKNKERKAKVSAL